MRRALVAACVVVVAFAAGITASGVVSPDQPNGAERCARLPHGPAARNCYIQELLADASTPSGLVAAADVLLADDDEGVAVHFLRECHEVFHDIGERFGVDGGTYDYTGVPFESCTFGIVHGANDIRLAAMSADELVSLPPAWCVEGTRAAHGLDGYKHSCLHGVGHAAMERSLAAGASFDEATSFVIDVCTYDAPSVGRIDRSYFEFHCLDGAYMQWALDAMRVDPIFATDDPVAACRGLVAQQPVAAQACYRQVTPLLLDRVDALADIVSICEAEAAQVDRVYVRHCIRSAAANAMGLTDSMTREAATMCAAATDTVQCVAEFDRSESYDKGPVHQPYGTLCAAVLTEPSEVARCTAWAAGGIELAGVEGIPAPAAQVG